MTKPRLASKPMPSALVAISAFTRSVDQRLLEGVPLVGLGLAGVGRDLETAVAEVAGDLLGRRRR